MYMIFYDRGYRAQDNGEHLCRWVMKNHKEIKTGYILNHTSSDWSRLKNEGFNLIDALDKVKTTSELIKCDYACSSIFNEGINLDFTSCSCKRIFLNHGCFLVPINYIKAEANNIDLFIATNKIEYNTLLHPYHGLSKNQVALCGQPRQDDLVKAQKSYHIEDSILIQFWTRPCDWCNDNNDKFLKSKFFNTVSELLSNKKLLDMCRIHGLKIIFKMHSIQYNWLKYFKKFENDVVKLSPLSEPFEPIFIRSKLIITDISSNAYEMAKINKPCIYFEPDEKELFSWRHTRNGGFEFNVRDDGIGPVTTTVNDTVNEIEKLISSNYKLDDKYEERRNSQIYFLNDMNNCKRCFDAILNVHNSKTNEKRLAKIAKINKKLKVKNNADGKDNCFLYF